MSPGQVLKFSTTMTSSPIAALNLVSTDDTLPQQSKLDAGDR
jgi:hypothetical protein